jgi:hypothetical protein
VIARTAPRPWTQEEDDELRTMATAGGNFGGDCSAAAT